LKSMSKTKMNTKTSAALKKAMAKVKSKSKQIPFNIFLPWGESIAQYIGTTLPEIEKNMETDPTLKDTVQSTCAMVRDFAVKQLMTKNQKTVVSLNDIC